MKQLRRLTAASIVASVASGAMADRINLSSDANVATSVARLETAVSEAGARVFAKVDFAKGSATQGETLRPTTVVIFGSPKIGSTALQAGQTMALDLPLRILFFEDSAGQTWATYDDPASVAPRHGLASDNPAVLRMQAALALFAADATGQ